MFQIGIGQSVPVLPDHLSVQLKDMFHRCINRFGREGRGKREIGGEGREREERDRRRGKGERWREMEEREGREIEVYTFSRFELLMMEIISVVYYSL